MEISQYIINNVENFILIFVRILGIFILAPFFGTKNVPTIFKIGLGFFTSIIVFSTTKNMNIDISNTFQYFITTLSEFIVGLIIGLASLISFSAIYLAGQLIDYQIGFGIVNILDIHSNMQVPLMGNFLYILTLLLFMLTNGHHVLFVMLSKSFIMIPLGGVSLDLSGLSDILTKMISTMFVLGFRISSPIVLTTFLTDLTLSIISRTIPQLNVFMVGMSVKIFVGLFTLIIMLPMYLVVIDVLFNGLNADVFKLMKFMFR